MPVGAVLDSVGITEAYRGGSVSVLVYTAGVSEVEMLGMIEHIHKVYIILAVLRNINVKYNFFFEIFYRFVDSAVPFLLLAA